MASMWQQQYVIVFRIFLGICGSSDEEEQLERAATSMPHSLKYQALSARNYNYFGDADSNNSFVFNASPSIQW